MKKYKLIKHYPNSENVGSIWTKRDIDENYWYTNCYLDPADVENNPEFFEEIIEKKYEILSFICTENLHTTVIPKGTILCKTENSKFENGIIKDVEVNLLKYPHWKIFSIKRLSDNEVFSIGDKCTNGIITGFKLDSNGTPYSGGIGISFHTEERTITEGLKRCEKAKPVLFVTEDCVEIFEGQYYCHTNPNFEILESKGDIISGNLIGKKGYYYFSSKEKAQEWIILNKPCLSINDLVKLAEKAEDLLCIPSDIKEFYNQDLEIVKELVKSRL